MNNNILIIKFFVFYFKIELILCFIIVMELKIEVTRRGTTI